MSGLIVPRSLIALFGEKAARDMALQYQDPPASGGKGPWVVYYISEETNVPIYYTGRPRKKETSFVTESKKYSSENQAKRGKSTAEEEVRANWMIKRIP